MANNVNVHPNVNSNTLNSALSSSNSIFITGGGGGGVTYSTGTWITSPGPSPTTSLTNPTGQTVMTFPGGDATVKITGNIEWNGENLQERLERIETMLHIPTRDVKLEEKFTKLKQLWIEYNTALEEYRTWERLKDLK